MLFTACSHGARPRGTDVASGYTRFYAVHRFVHATVACAVCTAVETPVGFDAVPDDAAFAVIARGREHVDGTLEAVKDISDAFARTDLEGLVVGVAAKFAGCHESLTVGTAT